MTATKLRKRRQLALKWLTVLALGAASGRGWTAEGDPFAEQPGGDATDGAPATVPSKSKVAPAPANVPSQSASAISPGIIEQLPASAYPEPYTRGLYGGPLWLDLQGLQWPYMPRTGIGISGYGWIDGNYRLIRSGNPSIPARYTEILDQGRFVLRVTPTYTNGDWFVQAQAEIVANSDQYDYQGTNGAIDGVVAADDVWVRTGALQRWDITVGRFQGFDVYPLGMGLDLNTYERLGAYDPVASGGPNGPASVAPLYPADYLFYRPAFPKVADAAYHYYVERFLRFEALGQFGNSGKQNFLGIRPAAIFDVGWLKLRGALEYQYAWAINPEAMYKNTQRNWGGAASAQFVFAPYAEAGVNFGYASFDTADASSPNGDNAASGNRLSYGAFVDFALFPVSLPNLLIGAGINYATRHNLLTDKDGNYERSTNEQRYFAIQYLFYRQLYVKLVGGYAKSHFENQATTMPYDDDMFSLRVRVQYLF